MLLVVVVINQYVLIINLVSLLNHTQAKDAVYNIISIMINENKYCSDVMKKYFNKEFVCIKMIMKIKRTKCWIYDNDYIDNDVKVRNHCYVTGKYRGSSAHREISKFLSYFTS